MMKKSYVTAPAPLSSIFSPKIFYEDRRRDKVEEIGATGGGFTLSKGVETIVELFPEAEDRVTVRVNGSETNFPTSIEAAEAARKLLNLGGEIRIDHRINVPLGTGFGTSASAALTTLLALFRMSGKGLTIREACRIVHEIEIKCKTGLNSEAGFLSEGLILVLREGAPPRVRVDSIPIPHDSVVISVVAASLDTSNLLKRIDRLKNIEEIGDKKLTQILRNPTPDNFLLKAREFASEAGLTTNKVEDIFEELEKLPVIGYAQNMIGEACHALALAKDAEIVAKNLVEVFPEYLVISSEVGGLIRTSLRF